MTYLRWLKSKITQWHEAGVINLAGSGVQSAEPILAKQLAAEGSTFAALLSREHDSMWGHAEYLAAIRKQSHLAAEQRVIPAFGASSALSLVFQAMLSGDADARVLVEMPTYDPLFRIPQHLRAGVDWLPRRRKSGYALEPAEVASRITPHTRLVALTNIHNPSGAVIAPELMQETAREVARVNPATRILVDETFAAFLGPAHITAATLAPSIISLGSLSKVYGLGSLRAGWIIASGETFATIEEAWLQMQNIGCRYTEALAVLVLRRLDAYEAHWRAIVEPNRALVQAKLGSLPGLELNLPEHGCVCFPRVTRGDADRLVQRLEDQFKVGVGPGRFSGTRRISGWGLAAEISRSCRWRWSELRRLSRQFNLTRIRAKGASMLRDPSDHDVAGLRDEINQYIVGRITILLAMVTAFGVGLGAIISAIPEQDEQIKGRVDLINYIALASNAVILVLFAISQMLLSDLTMLGCYLRVANKSSWEKDATDFLGPDRQLFSFGLNRALWAVLVVCTLATAVVPALIFVSGAGRYRIVLFAANLVVALPAIIHAGLTLCHMMYHMFSAYCSRDRDWLVDPLTGNPILSFSAKFLWPRERFWLKAWGEKAISADSQPQDFHVTVVSNAPKVELKWSSDSVEVTVVGKTKTEALAKLRVRVCELARRLERVADSAVPRYVASRKPRKGVESTSQFGS